MARAGRPPAYVGVSGVISPAQQDELLDLTLESGLAAHRRLLLGVKAVHKTQFLGVPNKYGADWYPIGAQAFTDALRPVWPRVDGVAGWGVAQVYLDVEHVGDPDYRTKFMNKILFRGRPWLAGIQFDMLPWHIDATMYAFLADLKEASGLSLLVQCHGPAMTLLGPDGAAQELARMGEFVDYALFDASHGTGTRLDVERLHGFVDAAYSIAGLDRTGVAVAGGLNGATVREDLPRLLAQFPDLSWDAEGALHPVAFAAGGVMVERPLDFALVRDYLSASAHVLTG